MNIEELKEELRKNREKLLMEEQDNNNYSSFKKYKFKACKLNESISNQLREKQEELKKNGKKITVFSTIGLSMIVGIITYNNSDVKTIQTLQKEIDIHSGHGIDPNGTKISPYLSHGCHIGGPDKGTVEERIIEYCNDHNYPEDFGYIAVHKYELEFCDRMDEAREINLYTELKKARKHTHKIK